MTGVWVELLGLPFAQTYHNAAEVRPWCCGGAGQGEAIDVIGHGFTDKPNCPYTIPRNARFHLMERSGHWPQFENAEEFHRLHLEFLRA